MRPVALRPDIRSIEAGSTETRVLRLRSFAVALGLAAPVLAVVATSALAAPQVSIPLGPARGQRANALLPDFVIKCASVYANPTFVQHPDLSGSSGFAYDLIAAVTVANIGPTTAHIDVENDPTWGKTSNLMVVTNNDALANGGWVATPTLAPGQSFTTQIGFTYNLPALKAPSTFTFGLYMHGNLKESNSNNDSYGPVTATAHNTCGATQYALPRLTSLKASRRTHSAAPLTPKLNPQPEPPSVRPLPATTARGAAQRMPITMHKIGLAPRPHTMIARALPAVRLPAGWSSSGGVLRAQRAGLRLRLSGGRTLVSRRAANGRLEYVVMDASGRIVKRERKNQRIRLAGGSTFILR